MGKNPSLFKGKHLPVDSVSFREAKLFIQKLNEQTGKRYRLPSEAEWEYAAREQGRSVRFGNGQDIAYVQQINFNGLRKYQARYSESGHSINQTSPVKSHSPNRLGLYDMSGNVQEWCEDWYAPYPVSSEADYRCLLGTERVLRGGSWAARPSSCRVAFRGHNPPDQKHPTIGFRLCLDVDK